MQRDFAPPEPGLASRAVLVTPIAAAGLVLGGIDALLGFVRSDHKVGEGRRRLQIAQHRAHRPAISTIGRVTRNRERTAISVSW